MNTRGTLRRVASLRRLAEVTTLVMLIGISCDGPAKPPATTGTPAPPGATPTTGLPAPPPSAPTPPPVDPTIGVPTPPPVDLTVGVPPPPPVPCGGPGVVEVSNAGQLHAALAQAQSGTVISLRDGSYPGRFAITAAGTADRPITLCGGRAAVLDGGPIDTGYTLHLRGAHHWRLSGFTIHGAQKGLVLDGTNAALIEGLFVHEVGDEAVHLRTGSSDNTVRANTIRRTGRHKAKFGEGIYVGSAESNWCTYTNCEPDRSDRNLIQANDIAETTSEAIDVKEGTSGGTVSGNTLSGAAMTAADSWIDVKGNDWIIADNIGTDAPQDGFQTHAILDGWGERNTFLGNRAALNAPGYAIRITKKNLNNTVRCTNRVTNAGAGLSNIPCQ